MLQADVYSRCNLGLSRIRAYAVWCAPGVRRVLARIRRAPGGVRRAYHPRRVGLGARSVAEAPGRRRGAEAPRAVHCVSWTSVRDFAGGGGDRRAAGPERGARDGGGPAPRACSIHRSSARGISSVCRRRSAFRARRDGIVRRRVRGARLRLGSGAVTDLQGLERVGAAGRRGRMRSPERRHGRLSAAPCRRARPAPWRPACLRERAASRARRGHGPPAASSGWQP